MKILALAIENLRKIKAATLDLKDGNLTQIRGPNRAGKSTILLAARMLFGGKSIVPKDAITHGKEEARIIGIVNDYTIKVIIKKNGAHSLTVEKEGMKKTKPQAFLDALAGKFLDPQWFSQLPGTEKNGFL
jgi:DNA repair ATPase RecN